MEHASSKLSVHSRQKMMHDYETGVPVARLVKEQAVSRTTFYRWLRYYKAEGRAGLGNHSCRPLTSPRRLAWQKEMVILAYRQQEQVGPARIAYALGVPRSSVHRVLCRHQRQHLRSKIREPIRRIVHHRPGAQIGIDFKQLASIGGGKPVFQISAIDSYSRLAFAKTVDRPLGRYAVAFLEEITTFFSERGVRVEKVLTDNGFQFTMRHAYHRERLSGFDRTCRRLGIRHQLTRPYRPQTNGKVERFHRTVDDELYRKLKFPSNEERADALRQWLVTYNTKRQHLALKGLTPTQAYTAFLKPKECKQCP